MFDAYLDRKLNITDTQVNYHFVCKRKLWRFTPPRKIQMFVNSNNKL